VRWTTLWRGGCILDNLVDELAYNFVALADVLDDILIAFKLPLIQ